MSEGLKIWVIFHGALNHPPGTWVVRCQEACSEGLRHHESFIECDSLDQARAEVPPGLIRMMRHPDDDPLHRGDVVLTDEEKETERLRKLVLGICNGQIFTSLHCGPEDLHLVFLPIALAERGQLPLDFGLIWEWMREASPVGINGMPTFFSCHFETRATTGRIISAWMAEEERRKGVQV